MPLGRQCIDHYRMLHRYNVFSHDEMVCNMASKADTLDVVLASAVHKDMVAMIQEEQTLRDKVKKMVGLSSLTYQDTIILFIMLIFFPHCGDTELLNRCIDEALAFYLQRFCCT